MSTEERFRADDVDWTIKRETFIGGFRQPREMTTAQWLRALLLPPEDDDQ